MACVDKPNTLDSATEQTRDGIQKHIQDIETLYSTLQHKIRKAAYQDSGLDCDGFIWREWEDGLAKRISGTYRRISFVSLDETQQTEDYQDLHLNIQPSTRTAEVIRKAQDTISVVQPFEQSDTPLPDVFPVPASSRLDTGWFSTFTPYNLEDYDSDNLLLMKAGDRAYLHSNQSTITVPIDFSEKPAIYHVFIGYHGAIDNIYLAPNGSNHTVKKTYEAKRFTGDNRATDTDASNETNIRLLVHKKGICNFNIGLLDTSKSFCSSIIGAYESADDSIRSVMYGAELDFDWQWLGTVLNPNNADILMVVERVL